MKEQPYVMPKVVPSKNVQGLSMIPIEFNGVRGTLSRELVTEMQKYANEGNNFGFQTDEHQGKWKFIVMDKNKQTFFATGFLYPSEDEAFETARGFVQQVLQHIL